jgi:cell division protein FtsL
MKLLSLKNMVLGLIALVVLLEGVQVYLSNRIAGTSIEVARLQGEIARIDEKNVSLKSELLSFSSFDHVSSRAAELGFIENKNQDITLKAPIPVALSN